LARVATTDRDVASQHSEPSFNLRFDYLPTDPANTTAQLRAFDERTDDGRAA
jgi:hypothetical protein